MNAKIESIAAQAGENITRLIREMEPDILDLFTAVAEESALQEKDAAASLAFTIKLNLDKSKATYSLAFGVRRKLDIECAMPDPDQAKLEFPQTKNN